jgi:hypothetical protein
MLHEQTTVIVYNFHLLSSHVERPELASFKATAEVIHALGGMPLPGTAQEVPADALDAQGRYRRLNTGWGALD